MLFRNLVVWGVGWGGFDLTVKDKDFLKIKIHLNYFPEAGNNSKRHKSFLRGSSNVVYSWCADRCISVHLWSSSHIAFFFYLALTGRLNQHCCQATRVTQHLNLSNLPLLGSLHGPLFCFGFGISWMIHGVRWNRVPNHSAVCSVPNFFLQLPSPLPFLDTIEVLLRQKDSHVVQPMSFHLWPWGGGGCSRPWCWAYPFSAATLQDSLPRAPRLPRFPHIKPQKCVATDCGAAMDAWGRIDSAGCLTSLNQIDLFSSCSYPGCPSFIQLSQVI